MNTLRSLTAFFLAVILLFSVSCNHQKKSPNSRYSDIEIEQYLQASKNHYSPEDLEGKAILLEFWATWCAPCVAQMPHLNQLAKEFENEPVQFISVTSESEEVVNHFLERNKINGWIGLDTNRSVFQAFDVRFIPKTMLLYPDGELAAVTRADEVTPEVLNRLIGHKPLNVKTEEGPKVSANPKKKDNKKDESFLYQINIKPTDKTGGLMRTNLNNGLYEADAISIKNYISKASGVPSIRVFGTDTLLDSYIDVNIKTPKVKKDKFRNLMIQSLENAFNIQVKRTTRPKQVYIMSAPRGVTKGLKKKNSRTSHTSFDDGVFAASAAPISSLLQQASYVTGKIILDETQLDEKYSWTVTYDTTNKMSVLDSLESNLGLKVKKETRKIEVIQVE